MSSAAQSAASRIIVSLRLGVALAAANVVCAAIFAYAWIAVHRSAETVSVTGAATQRIASDLIVWRGSVTAKAPELPAAYQQVKEGMEKTRAFLAARGVPEAEMASSAVYTETHHERDKKGQTTEKITGYTLRQTITVTSNNVLKIEELSRSSTELIEKGLLFESHAPEFIYTKLADLKIQMLAKATQDAATRAGQICTHSGARLGALKDADMGVMQINAANATDVTGYGVNDTSSYEKDVRATVSARFAVMK